MKRFIAMNEITSRQFNNEEVNRIIRRALRLEQADMVCHQDLIEAAREFGIDPKILEAAIFRSSRNLKRRRSARPG